MKEFINDVPIYTLKEKDNPDGTYNAKESRIVKAYLKELHRLGYLVPGDPILPVAYQVAEEEYGASYDGYWYIQFKQKNKTLMFVELDRIKAEYDEMYPTKRTKPVVTYDKSILKTMIGLEEDKLKLMGRLWMEQDPFKYTSHTMALEAYKMLMDAHEGKE